MNLRVYLRQLDLNFSILIAAGRQSLRGSALLLAFGLLVGSAIPNAASAQDLSSMSVEDLISLDITSVSKKPEKAIRTAASVYVISDKDIRRSGVTTLWDALRLAPGVNVMKLAGDTIAVSIRTENSIIADKVLVLVDGRTLNSPFNNNVFWIFDDIMLDNIDHIEVIRGAAGVLWGENAVSGLINVITKKSADLAGTTVRAGGGSYEQGFGSVRYGGDISVDTQYDIYSKVLSRGENDFIDGSGSDDDYRLWTSGGRLDSDLTDNDKLLLDSSVTWGAIDGFKIGSPANINLLDPEAPPFTDGNRDAVFLHTLARWERTLGEKSSLQFQTYYEHTQLDNISETFERDTADFDFQHRFPLAEINDIVWGVGYRLHDDKVTTPAGQGGIFDPSSDTYGVLSTFINNEIDLIEDTLSLSVGSKLTHNDFTGWEAQPGARLSWAVDETTTFWGAYTHAVRTPARLENDLHRIYVVLPPEQENDLPVALGFQGNKNVNAVKTDSYETGLRRQFSENLYVDLGGFFTHSDEALGLTATEPGISEYGGTPYVDALAQLDNTYTTEYHGGELVIDYRPFEQLRLVGSYAYLDGVSFSNDSSLDVCDGDPEHLPKTCAVGKVIPNNVFSLQSNWNPYDGLTIDTFVKFIDSFQTGALNEDGEFVDVNSYVNLDVRVAYKLTDSIELAVVGQNLAENKHVEWVDYPNSSAPINLERGVYGEIIFSLK